MSALATTQTRELSAADRFRDELGRMGEQFAAALPSHIKPEKFQRVVTTAVLSDPAILAADRRSLLEAAIRAAQDGLLPDKREGAFVVFNAKEKINGRDEWIKKVQWMPMIGGVIKRMHQSGEIANITAKVVYGGDTFRSWTDDDGEHVLYEAAENPDFDTVRQVFALAKTKDGHVYVETLTPRDIQKIRAVSRSADRGPWKDWWEEMAKKSAIRRLAKRLPLSTDMHDLMQRDNELYDLSQAPDPRPSLQDRLRAAKQSGIAGPKEGFASIGYSPEPEQAELEAVEEQDVRADSEVAADEERAPAGDGEADRGNEPLFDPATTDLLARYAKDMLAASIADGSEDDRLFAIKDGSTKLWAKDLQGLNVEARKVSEAIYKNARAIVRGDTDHASTITFHAEQLGVEESVLRGDA